LVLRTGAVLFQLHLLLPQVVSSRLRLFFLASWSSLVDQLHKFHLKIILSRLSFLLLTLPANWFISLLLILAAHLHLFTTRPFIRRTDPLLFILAASRISTFYRSFSQSSLVAASTICRLHLYRQRSIHVAAFTSGQPPFLSVS
jgi:hypothetical protein